MRRAILDVPGFVEECRCAGEVAVPKDRHEAKLTHYGQQALNHARAAEAARRYATDANRFVDIFLQVGIEDVFEHAGITVVVFGHDQDQSIRALASRRESVVLDLLSRIGRRKVQLSDVDQLRLDTFTLFDLFENKLRDVFAGAPFAHSSENNGNEEWSTVHRLTFQPGPSHDRQDPGPTILC